MKKINYKTLSDNDLGDIYHLSKKCLFSRCSIKEGLYLLLDVIDNGNLTLVFKENTPNSTKTEPVSITANVAKKLNFRLYAKASDSAT